MLRLEKTRLGEYLIAAFSYLMGGCREDRASCERHAEKDKRQWAQVAASEILEVKPGDKVPRDLCP